MILFGVIFIVLGAACVAVGIFNWDWFMSNKTASFFIRAFTRTGARIFYGLIGAACVVLGILILMGIIEVS